MCAGNAESANILFLLLSNTNLPWPVCRMREANTEEGHAWAALVQICLYSYPLILPRLPLNHPLIRHQRNCLLRVFQLVHQRAKWNNCKFPLQILVNYLKIDHC